MNGARALAATAALAGLLAAGPALADGKRPLGPNDRIDLNRASAAELMRLPGIGRARAEAIVAARGKAPFGRVEDVVAVKGISSGWLEKHRAHVVVSGAPPRSAAPAPTAPVARAAGKR